MAAMFMRSKLLSYASLFLSIQAYLNEPVNAPKTDDEAATAQPPLLRVLFSLIGVATCYMDIIFPSTSTAARIVQKSTEPEVKA